MKKLASAVSVSLAALVAVACGGDTSNDGDGFLIGGAGASAAGHAAVASGHAGTAGSAGQAVAGTSSGGSSAGGKSAAGAGGKTIAGGASAGGTSAGGASAGGSNAAGTSSGGSNAGGASAGSNAAGSNAAGSNAGGASEGGADAGGSGGRNVGGATTVAGRGGATIAGGTTSAGTGGTTSVGGAAGAGGADPYARAKVPTDCLDTHGYVGCCGPDGSVYFYQSGTLQNEACTPLGATCGWSATNGFYDCVDAATAEPTGTYSLTCNGVDVNDGTCTAGGASGAGGSAGSGGAATNPYVGAVVPTTCPNTHGEVGCCGPDGSVYYYDTQVENEPCGAGTTCGWSPTNAYYDCVDAADVDPSATYSLTCNGSNHDDGTCTAAGGAGGATGTGGGGNGGAGGDPYTNAKVPTTCLNAHGIIGCCGPDGSVYFYDTAIENQGCATGTTCGWNATAGYYDCVDAADVDPSGTFTLVCNGVNVDDGQGTCTVTP